VTNSVLGVILRKELLTQMSFAFFSTGPNFGGPQPPYCCGIFNRPFNF